MSQSYTKGIPVDTDPNMTANTNLLVPSQAAVVSYVANEIAAVSGVASVGATTPIQSSGGANPNISITQASPTTDGYITAADYVTFSTAGGVSASDAIAYAIALG